MNEMSNQSPEDVLRDVFGHPAFREGQDQVVGPLMNGRNVLGIMPTGNGKSICYQVPGIARPGLCVVVSPLLALMNDQIEALRRANVTAAALNSQLSSAAKAGVIEDIRAGRLKFLYVAPETLMTEATLGKLRAVPLSLIAIDEAHCFSRWGAGFRPEYADLERLSSLFPAVPIAAMTATADPETQRELAQKLLGGTGDIVRTGFDRPNISIGVAPKLRGDAQMLDFVDARRGQSGIVYCLSRKNTETVAEILRQAGHNALAYHAGLSDEERERVQVSFMSGETTIMAATVAFGMGTDKPDVRYVLHVELPSNIEGYYQEIGRAGRDGEPAEALCLFAPGDIAKRRFFIRDEDSSDDHKRREYRRLELLLAFCRTATCRRQALLGYFGEHLDEPCGNCDVCRAQPASSIDVSREAAGIIQAARATGQRFGSEHLISVLTGERTSKALKFNHVTKPVFGTLRRTSKDVLRDTVNEMALRGLVKIDMARWGGISAGVNADKLDGRTLLIAR